MLIATAGHIDHGKTALIRALTGVETDRLPEERRRGISINLGFAYWRPDQGPTIGFVDVPGHERFVSNMIAGLSGIEFALLVVAADDGIMPQTREHLHILQVLGIDRGLVALTKIDRVAPERAAEMRQAICTMLADTAWAGTPIFDVDAPGGTGIPALAAAIAAKREVHGRDEFHGFRLAIDRSFSVAGAGTVVTGTVVAGEARVGDRLILSPDGRELRVRGMQSAGRAVESITRGERCALNLMGLERADVRRGQWLVAPMAHAPTSRIEALVALAPDRDKPLRHDSHVHFHHGAASIAARVLVPRQRSMQPGAQALVQLVLDAPTSAVIGERFVLRDPSGRVLLGGGQVLDPLPSTRRRKQAERELRAAALALCDPAEQLAALASAPGVEGDLGWFAVSANLAPEGIERLLAGGAIVRAGTSGRLAIASERLAGLEAALPQLIGKHHADSPGESGLPRRAARAAMPEPVSDDLFDGLLRSLIAAGQIEADGALLRLPGHAASFSPGETEFWRKFCDALEGTSAKVIVPRELARELRMGEVTVDTMLLRRKASGDIWQVTKSKFMARQHAAGLAALAAELAQLNAAGFTAAEFRDASGLGRNFVIQLLEFFDRIGVTRRNGEARRMRGDWEAVTGPAKPLRRV